MSLIFFHSESFIMTMTTTALACTQDTVTHRRHRPGRENVKVHYTGWFYTHGAGCQI
jgi:hypothetical protein